MRSLLDVAIGQSVRYKQELRISIVIGSDILNVIPWEIICDGDMYLAHVYDIVRHPFSLQPARPFKKKRSNEILILAANPRKDIYVEGQIQAIEAAVQQDLYKQSKLRIVKETTVSSLVSEVFAGADILHIVAHGEFKNNKSYIDNYVLLHGDHRDKEERLTAEMLESFCRSDPMKLAVLCACRSAQTLPYEDYKNRQWASSNYKVWHMG